MSIAGIVIYRDRCSLSDDSLFAATEQPSVIALSAMCQPLSGFRLAPAILGGRLTAVSWRRAAVTIDRQPGAERVELCLELCLYILDGSRAGFVHNCFAEEVD